MFEFLQSLYYTNLFCLIKKIKQEITVDHLNNTKNKLAIVKYNDKYVSLFL